VLDAALGEQIPRFLSVVGQRVFGASSIGRDLAGPRFAHGALGAAA
jgi:hypothetical protein